MREQLRQLETTRQFKLPRNDQRGRLATVWSFLVAGALVGGLLALAYPGADAPSRAPARGDLALRPASTQPAGAAGRSPAAPTTAAGSPSRRRALATSTTPPSVTAVPPDGTAGQAGPGFSGRSADGTGPPGTPPAPPSTVQAPSPEIGPPVPTTVPAPVTKSTGLGWDTHD